MAKNDDGSVDFSELVEELLGSDWADEAEVDQLTELVARYGDPHAFHDELEEIIAQVEDELR